jgi:hypothetical protein
MKREMKQRTITVEFFIFTIPLTHEIWTAAGYVPAGIISKVKRVS